LAWDVVGMGAGFLAIGFGDGSGLALGAGLIDGFGVAGGFKMIESPRFAPIGAANI